MATGEFEGFRAEALQFLADLAEHNDRAWFGPRKADFARLVKEPMEALCTSLAAVLAARGIPLRADPARSPFRIYRDTRFSKDKSPYKTWQGASFPWAGDEASAGERVGVGGYFHLQPGEIYVGGGMWHPEPARSAAFRVLVDREPGRVHAAIDDPRFVATFGSVDGERLKRVPSGYRSDHPDAELLRLKDVVFSRRLSDTEVASLALPETLADAFEAALPMLRLLAGLRSAPAPG